MDRLADLLNERSRLRKRTEEIDAEIRRIKHALRKDRDSKNEISKQKDLARQRTALMVAALEVLILRNEGMPFARISERLCLKGVGFYWARRKAEVWQRVLDERGSSLTDIIQLPTFAVSK